MAMSSKNAGNAPSRISWAMVAGAIWAMATWALRQLRIRHDQARMARGVSPSAAVSVGHTSVERGGATFLNRPDQSSATASSDAARTAAAETGSTLGKLKADFSRYPPKEFGKRIWGKFSDDEITVLSTSFAYYWVFAIPPLLILIVMIAALLNSVYDVPVVENLRDMIDRRAPADSQPLLHDLVDNAVAEVGGNVASFSAIVTGLIALWVASSSVGILIIGFNRAYDVEEERAFVHKKLLTIGLTLVMVLFVNVAFALLVFGGQLGSWLADQLGLGSAFDLTWSIIRWPIAIAGIMVLMAFLYWKGPNVDQPFRWVTLGSAVATVLWLILVAGFGLYLTIADPGSAWGVVGSVIVLLLFLNFTGIIFFVGAEISGILHNALKDDAETAQGDA
jgi:membrane protein